jgi:hypothetical protein
VWNGPGKHAKPVEPNSRFEQVKPPLISHVRNEPNEGSQKSRNQQSFKDTMELLRGLFPNVLISLLVLFHGYSHHSTVPISDTFLLVTRRASNSMIENSHHRTRTGHSQKGNVQIFYKSGANDYDRHLTNLYLP